MFEFAKTTTGGCYKVAYVSASHEVLFSALGLLMLGYWIPDIYLGFMTVDTRYISGIRIKHTRYISGFLFIWYHGNLCYGGAIRLWRGYEGLWRGYGGYEGCMRGLSQYETTYTSQYERVVKGL